MNRHQLVVRAGNKIRKHGSLILTCGAVGGFFATVVFVAKGQMKADEIIAERNEAFESGEDENCETEVVVSAKERFDLTWKCYIPAGITGGLTLFCIIGSHILSRRQVAELLASLGVMAAGKEGLEKAIREKYGDEALNELRARINQITNGDGSYISEKYDEETDKVYVQVVGEETGNGSLLCYEGFSGRWFRSSEEAVAKAFDNFEAIIRRDLCASFNQLYDCLGIEKSHFGDTFGYIDYEHDSNVESDPNHPIRWEMNKFFLDEKNEEVLLIDIYTYPMEGWKEY